MNPPPIVSELVDRFERDRDSYTSTSYNETNTRIDFLDRIFEEGLGWDVRNLSGASRAYKDVIHGDSIKVSGVQKAPDYCFRVGGTRKFFLEAKKPSVVIKEDPEAAYQLRRYAWSAKLPLSILTNFTEFSVYDCRIRPKPSDKASAARVLYRTCDEYAEHWEEIERVFSKNAVLTGSFDRYAESTKDKRGTSEVDKEFLNEIEGWRDTLARNIALRNQHLDAPELNFAVQRTIDRIIFLRMCEDRGIERYGQLKGVTEQSNAYQKLFEIFEAADEKYNSGIFHFHKEKGRLETPDELTPRLNIDDTVLTSIIQGLYYPESPYEFSVLPATILGSVYEQFLGKVIRLTGGHHAKIEEKPEVKKAGGVYYTPEYIVDFIVRSVVGELTKGKSPKHVEKIRILDPACGSGSFLVGAYSFLADYHLDWYISHRPSSHAKAVYQANDGEWKLTTYEKKRILLNNIFGIDIDPQAVEVTKLNLLLKVLEDEDKDTLEKQQKLWRERALPDLAGNVKCGNSLIGTDFYRNSPQTDFSGSEVYRINAFDWNKEFARIVLDGGFDAVIGNPPWGASFSESELEYHRTKNKEIIVRMIDSFMYFVYQSSMRLHRNGRLGMILPDVIQYQTDNEKLREYILRNFRIRRILNLGDVFDKVTRPACILTLDKSDSDTKNNEIMIGDFSRLLKADKPKAINDSGNFEPIQQSRILDIPGLLFISKSPEKYAVIEKAKKIPHLLLKEIVDDDGIQRGVSPDLKEAFIVEASVARRNGLEKAKLRPVLTGGKQVKKYHIDYPDILLIYTANSDNFKNLPKICDYVSQFKSRITCKEVRDKKHSIFALHRPRDESIFLKPQKILGVITGDRIATALDENQVFATDGLYLFGLRPSYDPRYVLGVLNSRLFVFLYRLLALEEGRVLAQVKPTLLGELPMRVVDSADKRGCEFHDSIVNLVTKEMRLQEDLSHVKSPDERGVIQRQIDGIEHEIDLMVYKLYDLTDREVGLVEAE